jgi:hypothetical protein
VRLRLRRTALAVALASATLFITGCVSGTATSSSATHAMPDGSVMSGSSMPAEQPSAPRTEGSEPMAADGRGASGPSGAASMICGEETRQAVRRSLGLRRTPLGLHSWNHQLFSCTYQLNAGDLRLSVQDLDQTRRGRAHFARLRHRLAGATDIQGLANFGFPAFQTPRGDVVFLKDHKTLWVDATRLTTRDLPSGETRPDVAYGIASAVIGCWTE